MILSSNIKGYRLVYKCDINPWVIYISLMFDINPVTLLTPQLKHSLK